MRRCLLQCRSSSLLSSVHHRVKIQSRFLPAVQNGRRSLSSAMLEVNSDLVVTANVKRKQILLDMLPILLRMQSITDIKARLQGTIDEGNYAKALRMCSECLVVIDACKVRSQAVSFTYQRQGRLPGLICCVHRSFLRL